MHVQKRKLRVLEQAGRSSRRSSTAVGEALTGREEGGEDTVPTVGYSV